MRASLALPTVLVLAVGGCTGYLPVPQNTGNWEQARVGVYEQRRAAAEAKRAAEAAGVVDPPATVPAAAPSWPQPQSASAGLEPEPLAPLTAGSSQAGVRDAPVFGTTAEAVTPASTAPASTPAPVASPDPVPLAPPPSVETPAATEPEPPVVVAAVPAEPVSEPAPTPTIAPPVAETPAPIDEMLTPPALSGVGFLWPVPSDGADTVVTTSTGEGALLIESTSGEAFVAAENGVVVFAADALETYGRMVVVRHDGNYTTTYAQAGDVDVEVGEIVRRGQRLGSVGGDAAADPELYFEMRVDNRVVDPRAYLVGAPRLASR